MNAKPATVSARHIATEKRTVTVTTEKPAAHVVVGGRRTSETSAVRCAVAYPDAIVLYSPACAMFDAAWYVCRPAFAAAKGAR